MAKDTKNLHDGEVRGASHHVRHGADEDDTVVRVDAMSRLERYPQRTGSDITVHERSVASRVHTQKQPPCEENSHARTDEL